VRLIKKRRSIKPVGIITLTAFQQYLNKKGKIGKDRYSWIGKRRLSVASAWTVRLLYIVKKISLIVWEIRERAPV
jgi:hypothetical protein